MASQKQFNNRAKVITVAAIGKEFKKSAIIGRIIKAAKSNGHVATGKLTNPKSSRSLTPFADDRWVIRKDAVKVSSTALPSGEFMVKNLTVRVRYGLNGKYQNLSESFSSKKKWFPNVDGIANWIRAKQGRGEFSNVDPSQVKKVAWAIAIKQSQDGIKTTKFANAFKDRRNGVKPTLNKGINKAAARLQELYATSIERSIIKTIQL